MASHQGATVALPPRWAETRAFAALTCGGSWPSWAWPGWPNRTGSSHTGSTLTDSRAEKNNKVSLSSFSPAAHRSCYSHTYPPAATYRRSRFLQPPSCRLIGRFQTLTAGRRCSHRFQHGRCGAWGRPGPPTAALSGGGTSFMFSLRQLLRSEVRGRDGSNLHDIWPRRRRTPTQPVLLGSETLKDKWSHTRPGCKYKLTAETQSMHVWAHKPLSGI